MHPDFPKIQEAVHGVLSPAGFKRHKTIWTRALPDVLQLVALDKAPTGPRYWFDFGVNIRRICDDPRPLFYNLHLRWSDSELMPKKERLAWIDIKDLDDPSVEADERADAFARVARKYVLPTLAMVDSLEKVKTLIDAPTRKWPYHSGDPEVVKARLHVLWE